MFASPSPEAKKSKTWMIAIVVVLIVAVVLYFFLFVHPPSNSIPGNRILLNGTTTVDSGSYWYLQFIIPSNAHQIQVSGRFITAGGNENDIRVYIMTESSFQKGNFPEYGGSFSANYESGQVTTANFNVTPPSGGIYYLMFDNTFSNSQKNVDTRISLSYFYVPN